MVDYAHAFNLPFLNWKRFIAGCFIIAGLYLVIILVSVALTLIGMNAFLLQLIQMFLITIPLAYFVRLGLGTQKELPSWTDFGNILKEGVHVGIIALVYSIPFMILGPVISYTILGPEVSKQMMDLPTIADPTQQIETLKHIFFQNIVPKLTLFIPILFLLLILQWLIYNSAFFSYGEKKQLKEAFNIKKVFSIAFSAPFFLAILAGAGLGVASMIVLVVCTIVLVLTIVGIVLLPFLFLFWTFTFLVILFSILGQAYKEAKRS